MNPKKGIILFFGCLVVSSCIAQTPNRSKPDMAWQKNWKDFQISARMRLRPSLKILMSPNFIYSRTPSKVKGDPRNLAFEYWDMPDVYGWEELAKCVSLGWAKSATYSKQFGKPAIVAPARAVDDANYNGYRLVFLMQADKTWRCVLFLKKK